MRFRKSKRKQHVQFRFPAPTHHDKLVQQRINRVAYLLTLMEIGMEQRQLLLIQEMNLRRIMQERVVLSSPKTAQSETAMLQAQIDDLLKHIEALKTEASEAHAEIEQIIAQLPDELDTYALFASRLPALE